MKPTEKKLLNALGHTLLDRAATFAAALSDPTRLRLLSLILHNPDICVCDLEVVTKLPQTKISKHLAVLRNADLVVPRRQGTWMHYSVPKPKGAVLRGFLAVVQEAHTTVPELQRDLARLKSTISCGPEASNGKLVRVKL
ncbi:MAG TPA: metalloregulator ArsR/SmtB family transcription factor [Candidatus Kapabacteria bacterium]|nr:metalloregulator ArsR/SmtB family transcription factor [Candidatus Kapabacteria bacterium]